MKGFLTVGASQGAWVIARRTRTCRMDTPPIGTAGHVGSCPKWLVYLFPRNDRGKGKHVQSNQPIWGPGLLERLAEGSQSSEKSAKCNEIESQQMPVTAGPIEMPDLNACMSSHCWSIFWK